MNQDLCTCKSGKIIEDCCLKPFNYKTPGPHTGLKNTNCYLSELCDCSAGISGEHYVSHSILKELSMNGMLQGIHGLPWIQGTKNIPSSRLTSNILCKRHNEALSGLDTLAKRFFMSIVDVTRSFESNTPGSSDSIFLFNGNDIERWMLKTLIGLGFSGNLQSQRHTIRNWKPDLLWVDILVGKEQMPKDFGLYVTGNVGHQSELNLKRGFEIAPLSNQNFVYGAIISLCGLSFTFVMVQPPLNKKGTILEHQLYRPGEMLFTHKQLLSTLYFHWDLHGSGNLHLNKVSA